MKFAVFLYPGVEPIDLATFGVLSMARRIATEPGDLRRRLSFGRERPGEEEDGQRANECAAIHHRITSSACPSSDGGIVSPRALAVLRLMTSSNFVGCSTGRSPGFAPLRILST